MPVLIFLLGFGFVGNQYLWRPKSLAGLMQILYGQHETREALEEIETSRMGYGAPPSRLGPACTALHPFHRHRFL